MSTARKFAERTATALLSLTATVMTVGGVMLAGMGVTLRQTGFDVADLSVVTAGLMTVGAALAVTGAIGAILLRGRRQSDPEGRIDGASSTRLPLLAGAALPILLATQLSPLISYWRDVARLADQYNVMESANGPTALVFFPAAGVLLVPALEAMAAVAVAVSCGVVELLRFVRSTTVLRMSAVGALLVGGLCAGSWLGVTATERLAPAVETLIRTTADPRSNEQTRALELLDRHRNVGSQSARTLSWAWMAVALLAMGIRTAVRPQNVTNGTVPMREVVSPGMDERTRERALLDAADRLQRTTKPRRF